MWLPPSDAKLNARAAALHTLSTARGLLQLVDTADLAELTSLEEVFAEWQRQKLVPASLVALLWETLRGVRPELQLPFHRSAALALLNMAATADGSLLRCKMDVLIQQLRLACGTSADLVLARHACVALQACAACSPLDAKAAKALLNILQDLLTQGPPTDQADRWYATAEQAVNTVFAVSSSPEEFSSRLLHEMAKGTFPSGADEDAAVCSGALSRFLFTLGHVAIKTLAHFEACEKELTKRKLAVANGGGKAEAEASKKKGKTGGKADEAADALSQELGTDVAALEADCEALLGMGDRLLLPGALLGSWAPLVLAVVANRDGSFGAEARSAAVLTMCKFMAVSAPFCDDGLQLLFTALRRESEQSIRANIAVALGDLAVRHPNLLEPWTAHLYAQLRDPDVRVRKNMLMVLTHLILNDMVKVKGQISEMALCLLDEEPKIRSVTQLFFTEFAKKGSAPVYNLLPDMVASLSANESVGPDAFREILTFLLSFVQKDKQTESMAEKLCLRFDCSDHVQHHRDVAFCLGGLTHTERSVRKLQELSKTYVNKLGDAEVMATFAGISRKTRKFARPELKLLLDEFDAMLEAAAPPSAEQPPAAEPPAEAAAAETDADVAEGVVEEDGGAAPVDATEAEAEPADEPPAPAEKPAGSRRGKTKKQVPAEEAEEAEEDADENRAPRATKATGKGAAASKAKAEAKAVEPKAAAPRAARSSRRAAAA